MVREMPSMLTEWQTTIIRKQRRASHQLSKHITSFIQILHFAWLLVPVCLMVKELAKAQIFN
jgi:hypothetical protein